VTAVAEEAAGFGVVGDHEGLRVRHGHHDAAGNPVRIYTLHGHMGLP
jgi:hypothetical protein